MSNVRLSWVLPVPSSRQRPIAGVRIEARVDPQFPWTVINTVTAPGTELVIQDVAPGTWAYQAVVVDDRGNQSNAASTSVEVDYDAPSAVSEFGGSVEG